MIVSNRYLPLRTLSLTNWKEFTEWRYFGVYMISDRISLPMSTICMSSPLQTNHLSTVKSYLYNIFDILIIFSKYSYNNIHKQTKK